MALCDTFPERVTLVEQQLYFRSEYDPDYGLQSEEFVFECGWKFAPVAVLENIFRQLPDCDRLSMALTCKRWLGVFRSSEVWRCRSFRFGGLYKYRTEVWKALKVCRAFGRFFRDVEITCDNPTPGVANRFSHVMPRVVAALRWKKTQLYHLSLPRLQFDKHYTLRNIKKLMRLLRALHNLLKLQDHLVSLDMNNAAFRTQQADRVLKGLSDEGASHVRQLNLEDFLSIRERRVFDQTPFIEHLLRFTHLRKLYLNYCYVNDVVMLKLANSCGKTLEELGIKVYRLESWGHSIRSSSWNALKKRSPDLRVNLYLEGACEYSAIEHILNREMPVRWLQLWTGRAIFSVRWELCRSLEQIGSFYGPLLSEYSKYIQQKLQSC